MTFTMLGGKETLVAASVGFDLMFPNLDAGTIKKMIPESAVIMLRDGTRIKISGSDTAWQLDKGSGKLHVEFLMGGSDDGLDGIDFTSAVVVSTGFPERIIRKLGTIPPYAVSGLSVSAEGPHGDDVVFMAVQ